MATLDERLKDDDYRHWVKAVLCLQYTKDGLISFACKKSQDLHNAVLAQMRQSGNPSADGVCSTARIDFRRKAITCCANCNAFLIEAQKYCSRTLNLNNFDITDLHNQPWQLAKLFMNPGQDVNNTIPGQTDLSGILNFLDHCALAKTAILNTAKINAVKDTRNRILHTADMKITKQDFTTKIIPTLIALLQDPWFLSRDQVAQAAVVKINEVAAAVFHITKENEEKALNDLATELRCLSKDLNTKVDDLRTDLNRVETNVGQETKTQQDKLEQEMQAREKYKQMLEKNIHTLEQKVKFDTELVTKLSTDINTVKTSLEETRQGVDKLTSKVNRVEETCERKRKHTETIYKRETKILHRQQKTTEKMCERRHQDCENKHAEMAAEFRDLSAWVKKSETPSITDEEKAQLEQYLKEGYDENKLSVPILGSCHGVPISEIFAPVILTDTASGQEQEGGQPLDGRLSKHSITEDRRTRATQKLRSYKGIFIKENILQKKIFLLGKAGAGKSTFCKHLADVWSNDKASPQFDEAEFLKKFRYLFSVSCRFAEASESIFDMICNQLFYENDEMIKVASHVLKDTPDECLVVVDGIDEWKGSAREATGRRGDIPGLPSRKGLEDCVVLSTSRPERIHMLPVKLDKTCGVLELHGIENAEQLISSIIEKTEYANPRQSCLNFLSQIEQSNMTDLIQFPLMLINALNIWDMNGTLSNSKCLNYSNMVEGLFLRARDANRIETHQQDQEKENHPELPGCFRDTNLCKFNSGLIIRLGRLAFDLLFNDDQNLSLIFSEQQTRKFLTQNELEISLAVGILSKAQTSSRSIRRIDNFSFCHTTFQEFLGALWLSTEQSKIMNMFIQQFRSVDTVLENKVFIEFFCGLSPSAGKELWKYIADEVIEKDEEILNFRQGDLHFSEYKAGTLQHLILQCMKETRSCGGEQHRQLYYFIPHINVETYTDKMDLDLIYSSMEKYIADIKSVNIFLETSSYIIKNMKKMKSAIAFSLTRKHSFDCHRFSATEAETTFVFGSQAEPVFQFPDQLNTLQIKSVDLTACTLEFPLHLVTLAFDYIKMSHSVLEQLISYIHDSSDLHNLHLGNLYCSDHGAISCLPVLNLERFQSFVDMTLKTLPVEIVRLPSQETMPIQLRDLSIAYIKMSHSDIEQLCSCLRVSSTLEFFSLTDLRCSDHGDNNSCSDHGDRCCIPSVDLKNHHSLTDVKLKNLSVDSVLLSGQPEQHNTSGFCERPEMYIMMISVNMSSQSWKRFLDSLPHPPNAMDVELEECNIDNDTKSYIGSCLHFTVRTDDPFRICFETNQGQ